jgi:hypothetical protein
MRRNRPFTYQVRKEPLDYLNRCLDKRRRVQASRATAYTEDELGLSTLSGQLLELPEGEQIATGKASR